VTSGAPPHRPVDPGAFAAFLATWSGLTIAVAGVIAQDVMNNRVEGVTAFRLSAVVAVVVPFLLALVTGNLAVATVLGLAFAMAAATFCPLLLLGIWWRGLTDVDAFAGLVVGGLLTGAAVLDNLLTDRNAGWFASLVTQPAAWAVPLSFATIVAVSRMTRHRLPVLSCHTSRSRRQTHAHKIITAGDRAGQIRGPNRMRRPALRKRPPGRQDDDS
jgi:cation/acetate symporter